MRGRVYKVKNFRTTQKKMSINNSKNRCSFLRSGADQ